MEPPIVGWLGIGQSPLTRGTLGPEFVQDLIGRYQESQNEVTRAREAVSNHSNAIDRALKELTTAEITAAEMLMAEDAAAAIKELLSVLDGIGKTIKLPFVRFAALLQRRFGPVPDPWLVLLKFISDCHEGEMQFSDTSNSLCREQLTGGSQFFDCLQSHGLQSIRKSMYQSAFGHPTSPKSLLKPSLRPTCYIGRNGDQTQGSSSVNSVTLLQ